MLQTSTDISKLIPGTTVDSGNCLQLSLCIQVVVFMVLLVHRVYEHLTGRLFSVFRQRIYMHAVCPKPHYVV